MLSLCLCEPSPFSPSRGSPGLGRSTACCVRSCPSPLQGSWGLRPPPTPEPKLHACQLRRSVAQKTASEPAGILSALPFFAETHTMPLYFKVCACQSNEAQLYSQEAFLVGQLQGLLVALVIAEYTRMVHADLCYWGPYFQVAALKPLRSLLNNLIDDSVQSIQPVILDEVCYLQWTLPAVLQRHRYNHTPFESM